jgi:hypothetical protein
MSPSAERDAHRGSQRPAPIQRGRGAPPSSRPLVPSQRRDKTTSRRATPAPQPACPADQAPSSTIAGTKRLGPSQTGSAETMNVVARQKKAGRRPNEIDRTLGPWHVFCADLRELKEKNGDPSFADLAEAIGYAKANTLSRAVSIHTRSNGTLLLGKWDYIEPYVAALGGDVRDFRDRYEQAIEQLGGTPDQGRPDQSPPCHPDQRPNCRHRCSLLAVQARKAVEAATKKVARAAKIARKKASHGVGALALVLLLVGIAIGSHPLTDAAGQLVCISYTCAPGQESSDTEPTWGEITLAGATLYTEPRGDSSRIATVEAGDLVRLSCWITADPSLINRWDQVQQTLSESAPAKRRPAGERGNSVDDPQDRYGDQTYKELRSEGQRLQDEIRQSTWWHVETAYQERSMGASGWISAKYVSITDPGRRTPGC